MLLDIVRILIIVGCSFLLYKNQKGVLRSIFWYALSWKILAGLAVGYLYHFYYPSGDTLYFFSDASTIVSQFKSNLIEYVKFLWSNEMPSSLSISMEPRTLFFTKILSFLCFFSGENYWTLSVYCSWLSFCGAWYLVSTISRSSRYATAAIIAFLVMPVEIFWSSGVQKEAVVMPCLFVMFATGWKVWKQEKISVTQWLWVLVSVFICWKIKYFYVGVCVPILVTSSVYYSIQSKWHFAKSTSVKIALWMVILVFPIITIMALHPNFYASRILNVIVENYHAFVAITDVKNLIEFEHLEPSIWSMLYYAPKALISAFFRPFIWEVSTILQGVVSFENLCILLLAIGFMWKYITTKFREDKLMICSWLLYSVLLGALLALSTPSFGTLIRFRVGFMPFLIFVFILDNPIVHFIQYRVLSNGKNQL
jgi:hypothetical protein